MEVAGSANFQVRFSGSYCYFKFHDFPSYKHHFIYIEDSPAMFDYQRISDYELVFKPRDPINTVCVSTRCLLVEY